MRFLAFMLCAGLALADNSPRFTFSFPSTTRGTAAAAVDSHGNTYLAGTADGNDLAATSGAFQTKYPGSTCYGGGPSVGVPIAIPCHSPFVVKLDPFGTVVFATYLGASSSATPSAIAFDSQGNVYLAGTVQGDFPVTGGAAFPAPPPPGNISSFLAKLNPSGTQLEFATFIPATIEAIALDSAGNIYFAGADSPAVPFPTTAGAFQKVPSNSNGNAVVGELNASGTALLYGTYLSGSQGLSNAVGIAVDAAGNALVGGSTTASDFPATAGVYVAGANGNLFLAELKPDGSGLIYSHLLGAAVAGGMKVSASGDVYFAGNGAVSAWPSASAPFGGLPASGGYNDFLFHLNSANSMSISAIDLPFVLSAVPGTLDVDSAGDACVLAYGMVTTTAGSFQPAPLNDGAGQILVAKVTPAGQVAGATYAGLLAINSVTVIASGPDGSVVVAGDMAAGYAAENFFPAITIGNAASYAANAAVPGEIVAIQGYGIGPSTGVTSAPINLLSGVQVYFDNFPAPVFYAQAEQINVQVPWEIAGQAATQLKIVYNGAPAGAATLPVAPALPGIFFIENADGSLNSPSHPARRGDYVALYGTGGGAMSQAGVTGAVWPLAPLSYLTQPVSVTVGAEAAQFLYGGSAPTLDSGFFQINAGLPSDLTPSVQLLFVTIGGVNSVPVPISIQ